MPGAIARPLARPLACPLARPLARLLPVLLALGLAAGCAADSPAPGATPAGTSAADATSSASGITPSAAPLTDVGGCITPTDGELLLDEGGTTRAEVALLGTGTVGVVVSYETSRDVCDWLPLADRLVAAGYLVLLQDGIAGTSPEHAVDRVALLRSRGIGQVVLVGGSIGGAASKIAAAEIDPPVAAVVSLSGGGTDTTAAAAEITVPVLQVVASGDQPFAAAARADDVLLTGSPDHQLLELPGSSHASQFFRTDEREQVLDAIVDFLAAHAPPR